MKINLCMGCMREKTEKGACKYCGFDESVYEASLHQLPRNRAEWEISDRQGTGGGDSASPIWGGT